MKNNASLIYNLFLIVGDFLALVAAFAGAFILRVSLGVSLGTKTIAYPVPAITYLRIFVILVPFWIMVFALLGLYNSNIYEKRFSEAGRLFMGSFVGLLFVLGYAYASNQPIFPAKLVPVYGFGLAFLFLLIFRNLARLVRGELFRFNIGITNLLIIGDTAITSELIESLADSRVSGYCILGVVGRKEYQTGRHTIPAFSSFQVAAEQLGPASINSIVQTELYADIERNNAVLNFAQENHIAYRFIPGNTELFVGNIEVELFRSSVPVIAVHQTALIGWGRVVKRLFDLAAASVILVIASPLLVLFAIAIKLSDGGPVFLRQVRLTRFNQKFRVFKFRSHNVTYNGLTPDEAFEKMNRPDLLRKFRENGNFLVRDPRETTIGRFMRATSLDELPQLFNVISGDLSLVGPRALIPKDLAEYKKRHTILSVKSGITGLAQVSGRNNIPFEERRKLDTYYVQNWSFWLDIVILLKTARAVITHEHEDKQPLS
jgi:exopolysaccharide biosynthesis polyprenyl glycosylphosphotransferase